MRINSMFDELKEVNYFKEEISDLQISGVL